MEAVRVAFAFVGLIGMIGLFRPIAKLSMTSRWHAFAWLVVGCIGTAAIGPRPQQRSTFAAGALASNVQKVVATCKAMQVAWEADDMDRVKQLLVDNKGAILTVAKGGDNIEDPAFSSALRFSNNVIEADAKLKQGNTFGWSADVAEAIHTCSNSN